MEFQLMLLEVPIEFFIFGLLPRKWCLMAFHFDNSFALTFGLCVEIFCFWIVQITIKALNIDMICPIHLTLLIKLHLLLL